MTQKLAFIALITNFVYWQIFKNMAFSIQMNYVMGNLCFCQENFLVKPRKNLSKTSGIHD